MIQGLKSVAYFPEHVAGVFLLMFGVVASWFCWLASFLFGVLMLADELPERWDVIAGLAIAGVVFRFFAKIYVLMLAMLKPA